MSRISGVLLFTLQLICWPTASATTAFAQFPAEAAFRTPLPNVIVSVDNTPSLHTPDVSPQARGAAITRLQALKQLLRDLFAPDSLPDDAIRLAYQATHGCTELPAEGRAVPTTCTFNGKTNRMSVLRGSADPAEVSTRGAFLRWVDELDTGDGRGAHHLLDSAGGYLMQTDAENPWSDTPGVPQAASEQQTCRRAYHLLLSDAAVASQAPANLPAFNITPLPDGTFFDPATNPQLRIYASSPTSASALALRYWSTDLQPALGNRVSPTHLQTGDELHAAESRSLRLAPYWNPRNNPASWQHMVTFTVDLGGRNTAAQSLPPEFSAQSGTWGGADYESLLLGSLDWPAPSTDPRATRSDLWHTALNSRGEHFRIEASLTGLQQALASAIARIAPSDTAVVSGMASSGSGASYTASYNATRWSGKIVSHLLAPEAGHDSPNPLWGMENDRPHPRPRSTADKLDARADIDRRLILTHDGARGAPFRMESLSKPQQRLLGSPELLQFLRGDRRLESSDTTAGFRARQSRQGDIVHSRIWQTGRPALLHVGGNDGMLHVFSATTGDELMAYVPRGVYPALPLLARHDYQHHYYVDGSPFTGDALIESGGVAQRKTFLVGTLGAGGPGYFVLDVSALDGNLPESRAADIVVLDRTDGSDPDIGHVFAAPVVDEADPHRSVQITRMNNGRWAAMLGNGYGSANGRPVLLIQYLDGARELVKIAASASSGSVAQGISNGLSAPRPLDVNGDDVPDFVYAGDLQGHLWKFDLSAASDQRWGMALDGAPLFTAKRDGLTQPITVAPVLRLHPQGNSLMLAFGTGQELSEADSSDSAVQTIYSVMDYTRYRIRDEGEDRGKVTEDTSRGDRPRTAASRDELMGQHVQTEAIPASSSTTRTFWDLLASPFAYCTRTPCAASEKKGWYIDLPAERERVLDPLSFLGGGNLLEITSRTPVSAVRPGLRGAAPAEACEHEPSSGQTYRTVVHIATGMAPQTRTMDTNGDGLVNADDAPAARSTASRHELRRTSATGRVLRHGSDGARDQLAEPPTRMLRPSWRQLK